MKVVIAPKWVACPGGAGVRTWPCSLGCLGRRTVAARPPTWTRRYPVLCSVHSVLCSKRYSILCTLFLDLLEPLDILDLLDPLHILDLLDLLYPLDPLDLLELLELLELLDLLNHLELLHLFDLSFPLFSALLSPLSSVLGASISSFL